MKNRLFETGISSFIIGKNIDHSHDLKQLIGKKIELSLRNQEPIVGILDTCNDTSVELLICGHSFMINRNDILGVGTSK
jgi:hypothetical protein